MRRLKYPLIMQFIAMSTLCATAPAAFAQDGANRTLEELVVTGGPVFRDRTNAISPELQYTSEFFQQFEPTSVGDMLKRTPGVAFSSDVGEYDSPQLRGLGQGYTQILVNGRRIPGSGADRSVFVDRIPAEMVERIVIVRSASADSDSQGIGGTINIILKDGASLEGGDIRLGLLNFDGDKFRNSAALTYGGQTDDKIWSLSATFSERYVPKDKTETVRDPESLELKSIEFEEDVRDSDDISLSGQIEFPVSDDATLGFNASYIQTERAEDQKEFKFEVEDGEQILDELTQDDVDITEDSIRLESVLTGELSDKTGYEASIAFSNTTVEEVADIFERGDFDEPFELVEIENIDVDDQEVILNASFTHALSDTVELKAGISASTKERDESLSIFEVEDGEAELDTFQTYSAEEDRLDAFLLSEFSIGDNGSFQIGGRLESTDRTISNEEFSLDTSDTTFNPSAHLSLGVGENGTIRASLAKTVRRPGFDQLTPTLLEDEPEDGDAQQGNPNLDNEVSVGADIGYETRLSQGGIFGVNFFYRDVSDVIEEAAAGLTEAGGLLYSFQNTGDGEVYGVEFDLNYEVSDNTGFFANVTFLDSKITDPFTLRERTFRDQPEYIYNFGVTHNIPDWNASAGFSYQKQGESLSVDLDRDVLLEYDGNLEIFFEKRFENDLLLRLTGTNLLDAEKREEFLNYDGDSAAEIIANHRAGDVDELENEVETAGPVVTLTLRKRF